MLFWMTMLTAAATNVAAVLTPMLQRKLIATITVGEMDTRKILAVCLVSLLGIAWQCPEVSESYYWIKRTGRIHGQCLQRRGTGICSGGAGESFLAKKLHFTLKLLLGELEPTDGSCTYGNRKVSEIDKYVLYSGIRYYSQDVEIFNRDLQFNIAMGKKPLNAEESAACRRH